MRQIKWQHQMLSDATMDTHVQYWHETLGGELPAVGAVPVLADAYQQGYQPTTYN